MKRMNFSWISPYAAVRFGAYLGVMLLLFFVYGQLGVWDVDIALYQVPALYVELPLVLFALLLFYFPNRYFWKSLLGGLVVLLLYVFHDVFGLVMKRAPRISDFENFMTLFAVSWLWGAALLLAVALWLGLLMYSVLDFAKTSPAQRRKQLFWKLFFIFIASLLAYFGAVKQWFVHFYDHSLFRTAMLEATRKHGRASTFIYDAYVTREIRRNLTARAKETPAALNQAIFGKVNIEKPRNIYIIVLESFVDPRLIENLTFSRDPLAEGLKKYLPGGQFSYCKSPVYGGGTAQAEFEVLTSIPALSKFGTIEFNMLGGQVSGSLISFLKQHGYQTHAAIATVNTLFNSASAYRSLGFDDVRYVEEMEKWRTAGDQFLFDGDVFRYGIQRLSQLNKDRPYIFYMLGVYGHLPFPRNKNVRPDVVQINRKSEFLNTMSQYFYYRTEALAHYMEHILRMDPDALIFVSSDHLPILELGQEDIRYKKDLYENICLFLDAGKPVAFPLKAHHQIPAMLLASLGEKVSPSDTPEALYERVLANSWR